MRNLAEEIFNILKGANYKLRLFTSEGIKTTQPEQATRFYSYDKDLMVTIRLEDAKTEVLVQAGQDYDIPGNKKLIDSLKSVAHNNLGEFTVRKFDKKIAPKDFAHQSVEKVTEGFSKPFGSIKTSYIQMPFARLTVKHSKGVNEEVRGARSRNIHSLFIENAQGERFKFPYRYMSGAKAMAMHVNEGGTPYDAKGEAILALCEEIADLNKFVRHVKSNNLVNEANGDIVEAVQSKLAGYKNTINSLSTQRGYNNFQVQENSEDTDEKSVDITEKFLYNTFTTEELTSILGKVGRIVSENTRKEEAHKEVLQRVLDVINSKQDLQISFDENDPEHPDNQKTRFASGPSGELAKLNMWLGYLAGKTKNDELWNALHELADGAIHDMNPKFLELVVRIKDYLIKKANTTKESIATSSLDEDIIMELRRKIS